MRFTLASMRRTSTAGSISPGKRLRRISIWWSTWNPGRRLGERSQHDRRQDRARRALRLNAKIEQRRLVSWNLSTLEEDPIASRQDPQAVIAVLGRSFEFKIPLALLLATPVASTAARQAESTLHQALTQSNPPPAVISHDGAVLAPRRRFARRRLD